MNSPDGINFVLVRNGKILLQKRDNIPGIMCPGEWCIPSETTEKGEDSLMVVVRGIKEETGLDVMQEDCKYLCMFPWDDGKRMNMIFICFSDKGEVISGEGKMYWKTLEEVKKIKLAWDENVLIPKIEERIIVNSGS